MPIKFKIGSTVENNTYTLTDPTDILLFKILQQLERINAPVIKENIKEAIETAGIDKTKPAAASKKPKKKKGKGK